MGLTSAALGVICALAALFTSLTRGKRRDHDDTLLALALTWVWAAAVSVQMVTANMSPDAGRLARFEAGAMIDLAFGLFIVSRIHRRSAGWKLGMAVMNLAALAMDAAFLISDRTRETGNMCRLALNFVFVAMLFCIASPGARDAFRRYRLWVSDRLRSRARAGARVA